MIKKLNMIHAEKALSEEELAILSLLTAKIDKYQESLRLHPGDQLKRIRDGKLFTYIDRAPYGCANIYVEELEHYVYEPDFEKVMH